MKTGLSGREIKTRTELVDFISALEKYIADSIPKADRQIQLSDHASGVFVPQLLRGRTTDGIPILLDFIRDAIKEGYQLKGISGGGYGCARHC